MDCVRISQPGARFRECSITTKSEIFRACVARRRRAGRVTPASAARGWVWVVLRGPRLLPCAMGGARGEAPGLAGVRGQTMRLVSRGIRSKPTSREMSCQLSLGLLAALDQCLHWLAADLPAVRAQGGQGRDAACGKVQVVVADGGQALWHPDAAPLCLEQHAQSGPVVGADDAVDGGVGSDRRARRLHDTFFRTRDVDDVRRVQAGDFGGFSVAVGANVVRQPDRQPPAYRCCSAVLPATALSKPTCSPKDGSPSSHIWLTGMSAALSMPIVLSLWLQPVSTTLAGDRTIRPVDRPGSCHRCHTVRHKD